MMAVELRMAPDPAHLHGNQEQEHQRPATLLVPVHEHLLMSEAEAEVTVGRLAPKRRHGERRLLRLVPVEQRVGDTHRAPLQVPLTPLPQVGAWLLRRLVR
jgi:hypothetical protein